jgi:large subunit ribosomal protein L13
MKTFSAKPKEITRKWYLIDAEGVVLGRLAAEVSKLLRGKHKVIFTPHVDTGDHVVIINAAKVKITGNKAADRVYYKHTGHPGGIKERTAAKILEGKKPEEVVELAIRRMFARRRFSLMNDQLSKLRVYAGSEHPHSAQNPITLDLAARNSKNKRVKDADQNTTQNKAA